MFFFPGQPCYMARTANKDWSVNNSLAFDWKSFDSSEIFSFISLDEILFPRKSRFKVNFIASFASLVEFYFSCLLIDFFAKQAFVAFLENSINDLIKVFQNHISVHFIKQTKIEDIIKSLFVPLKLLLDSLHPIKIAA